MMNERTASALILTTLGVVLVLALFVLEALHASNDAIVLAYIVALAVGGISCGRVVVHYSEKPPSRRDRR